MTLERPNLHTRKAEFDTVGKGIIPRSYQSKISTLLNFAAEEMSQAIITNGSPRLEVGLIKTGENQGSVIALGVLPSTKYTEALWNKFLHEPKTGEDSPNLALDLLLQPVTQLQNSISRKARQLELWDVTFHVMRDRKDKEIVLSDTLVNLASPDSFYSSQEAPFLMQEAVGIQLKAEVQTLFTTESY